MRASAFGLVSLLLAFPLLAEPVSQLGKGPRLDKGQGESAMRLIRDGETVRFFCKSCTDVVYTTLQVETRTLRPIGGKFELLLNDQPVDANELFVDSGYGDGWDNLAELLGFVPKDSSPKLSRGLDDIARLTPHIGLYTGTLGENTAKLELVLEGRRVTGSLSLGLQDLDSPELDSPNLDGRQSVRPLRATAFNATRERDTLTLVERDKSDNLAATLSGQLDAENRTFTGTRSPLDGSSPEPFQLTRVDETP